MRVNCKETTLGTVKETPYTARSIGQIWLRVKYFEEIQERGAAPH